MGECCVTDAPLIQLMARFRSGRDGSNRVLSGCVLRGHQYFSGRVGLFKTT